LNRLKQDLASERETTHRLLTQNEKFSNEVAAVKKSAQTTKLSLGQFFNRLKRFYFREKKIFFI
jgi:hypothetical protein